MKQISVKLTDAENREFEDLAGRLGLSASDTIRFLINRGGREQSVIEKLDTILSHFESGGSVSNDHFLARLEGIEGRVESIVQALMKLIERLMGGLLILVGLALVTGAFTDFSYWMLETYEFLGVPLPG